MIEFYLILILVFLVIIFITRIKQIKAQNYLSIFDGLFFGGIYFILIPVLYSFISGNIILSGLPSFDPFRDSTLTIYIFTSIFIFGLSAVLYSKNDYKNKSIVTANQKILFTLSVLLYFIALIAFFISSGKLNGNSHWYSANESLFQSSSGFVLLGQIHNVCRVIVPGLCMYFQLMYLNKGKYFKAHFIISIAIIVFELLLAGNRIVVLFFIFSIFLPLFLHKKYTQIFYILMICLPLTVVAKFWPMVRGMIWAEEVSIERFVEVINLSYENEISLDEEQSNPILLITEGSNIVPLKFLFDNYPEKFDFTMGNTMILKSFGTLIPKSVWPSKPDGNGGFIGKRAYGKDSNVYLNSTLLGDAWSNFGFIGPFYIVLILYNIQRLFSVNNFGMYSCILFMVSIASWRFDFAFYIVSIIILFIIFFLMKINLVKAVCLKLSNKIFE